MASFTRDTGRATMRAIHQPSAPSSTVPTAATSQRIVDDRVAAARPAATASAIAFSFSSASAVNPSLTLSASGTKSASIRAETASCACGVEAPAAAASSWSCHTADVDRNIAVTAVSSWRWLSDRFAVAAWASSSATAFSSSASWALAVVAASPRATSVRRVSRR